MKLITTPKLSRRLQAITEQIPPAATLADIGSDHAFLPCYTCLEGMTPWAIASEVAQGPLRAVQQQVFRSGLAETISVRLGDGLNVLARAEVDVVVIAGMGGHLMVDILDAGQERLQGISRLILQPNVREKQVRLWLMQHDWELIDEVIIEEDGTTYEILIAEAGAGGNPYATSLEAELTVGPFLKKKKDPVFCRKWQRKLLKKKQIYAQLQLTLPSIRTEERKQILTQQIHDIEEMLR